MKKFFLSLLFAALALPAQGDEFFSAVSSANSVTIPAATVEFDFMAGSLPAGLAYTRSGNAWCYNSSGVLTQLSANVPCFEYSPTTMALRGMRIEGGKTNLITRSNDLAGAGWTATNLAVASSAVVAPDGSSMQSITDDATNGNHVVKFSAAASNSTAYTCSAFLKKGTSDYGFMYLTLDGGATAYGANFNLNTCAQTNSYSTGSPTTPLYEAQTVANGVCRVSVTYKSPASGSAATCGVSASNAASPNVASSLPSYAGTGTSIYAWGAQLEANEFMTSPCPSSGGTSCVRSADNLVSSSLSFYAATSTVYTRFSKYSWGRNTQVVNISFITTGSYADGLLCGSSWNKLMFSTIRVSSSTVASLNGSYFSAANYDAIKSVCSFSSTQITNASNGSAVSKTTGSWAMPNPTQLKIGEREGTVEPLFGYIQNFKYWNTVLSDIQQKVQSNK